LNDAQIIREILTKIKDIHSALCPVPNPVIDSPIAQVPASDANPREKTLQTSSMFHSH